MLLLEVAWVVIGFIGDSSSFVFSAADFVSLSLLSGFDEPESNFVDAESVLVLKIDSFD